MNIFDDTTHQILMKFLDKKVKDAEEEIATKGTLSEEHAIPLILKTQFNHIMHLDLEITELRKSIDLRFVQVNGKLEQMGKRVTQIFAGLTIGFTIIAFLIILFGFLK